MQVSKKYLFILSSHIYSRHSQNIQTHKTRTPFFLNSIPLYLSFDFDDDADDMMTSGYSFPTKPNHHTTSHSKIPLFLSLQVRQWNGSNNSARKLPLHSLINLYLFLLHTNVPPKKNTHQTFFYYTALLNYFGVYTLHTYIPMHIVKKYSMYYRHAVFHQTIITTTNTPVAWQKWCLVVFSVKILFQV